MRPLEGTMWSGIKVSVECDLLISYISVGSRLWSRRSREVRLTAEVTGCVSSTTYLSTHLFTYRLIFVYGHLNKITVLPVLKLLKWKRHFSPTQPSLISIYKFLYLLITFIIYLDLTNLSTSFKLTFCPTLDNRYPSLSHPKFHLPTFVNLQRVVHCRTRIK